MDTGYLRSVFRPFKAEIRVRFPLALPIFGVVWKEPLSVECVIIQAQPLANVCNSFTVTIGNISTERL
jgi:hypothetical protein